MIVASIYAGTAKNVKYSWNEEIQIAFDEVKKIHAPLRYMYRKFQKPFIAETDTSDRLLSSATHSQSLERGTKKE